MLEHCGLLHLEAHQYLHKTLSFLFWTSNSFEKKSNFGHFFEKVYWQSRTITNFKTKTTRIYGGINGFPNAKNRNVLASKLRPVKTFKCGKRYFTAEGNSATRASWRGWSYIWQTSSSHDICMVTDHMKCLVCLYYSLPQSKSNCKVLQVILLPASGLWRHVTS